MVCKKSAAFWFGYHDLYSTAYSSKYTKLMYTLFDE